MVSLPIWLAVLLAALALWALVGHLLLPGARWILRRRVNRVLEQVEARLKIRTGLSLQSGSRTMTETSTLTSVTTSAPRNAGQNPATRNPRPSDSEIPLVSHSISALTPLGSGLNL